MSKILSIAIQKGGCAKTTTTINLGSCLAQKGHKVLLIDLDPQGNLSYGCGVEDTAYTIAEVFAEEYDKSTSSKKGIKDAIVHKPENCNFDIVTANILLADADHKYIDAMGRGAKILKSVLEPVKNDYDYILIDCPPSLGILTVNAFLASDFIIIPMEPSYFALQGLSQLNETIEEIREMNEKLKVLGILQTRYTKRNNITQVATEEIQEKAEEFGIQVFKTRIQESVVVKESQALQLPLAMHEPKSKPYLQYQEFTNELLSEVADYE